VAAKPLLVWLMIVSNYGGVLFNIDIIDLEILPWESILSNQYFMERASWTLLNFLGPVSNVILFSLLNRDLCFG
jgi:hypothetical protein